MTDIKPARDRKGEGGQVEECLFCTEAYRSRAIARQGTVFAVPDGFPVTPGHLLIIPLRHTADFFSMTPEERDDLEELLILMKDRILEGDPAVTGFNIGVNCGVSAGQSIMHAHVHLIPRRDGDTANPKGGVRGVIPGKRGY